MNNIKDSLQAWLLALSIEAFFLKSINSFCKSLGFKLSQEEKKIVKAYFNDDFVKKEILPLYSGSFGIKELGLIDVFSAPFIHLTFTKLVIKEDSSFVPLIEELRKVYRKYLDVL